MCCGEDRVRCGADFGEGVGGVFDGGADFFCGLELAHGDAEWEGHGGVDVIGDGGGAGEADDDESSAGGEERAQAGEGGHERVEVEIVVPAGGGGGDMVAVIIGEGVLGDASSFDDLCGGSLTAGAIFF